MNITIIPLGTVSPFCYQNMNCPGFLIKYKDYNILLDCGNGVTRYFDVLNDLKKLHIFISHYHFDHYSDIYALQYASFVNHNLGLLKEKINIYLPKDDLKQRKQNIKNNEESFANYHDIDYNKNYYFDDLKVSFEDNKSHPINSYMTKLENDDYKIVYTADVGTTNLDGIVDFSKNADLLICEASLLLEHNSNSKTHLTAHTAAEIAKKAKVKKLLLTHFYPLEDKRKYLKEAQEVFKESYVAYENKKIILRR